MLKQKQQKSNKLETKMWKNKKYWVYGIAATAALGLSSIVIPTVQADVLTASAATGEQAADYAAEKKVELEKQHTIYAKEVAEATKEKTAAQAMIDRKQSYYDSAQAKADSASQNAAVQAAALEKEKKKQAAVIENADEEIAAAEALVQKKQSYVDAAQAETDVAQAKEEIQAQDLAKEKALLEKGQSTEAAVAQKQTYYDSAQAALSAAQDKLVQQQTDLAKQSQLRDVTVATSVQTKETAQGWIDRKQAFADETAATAKAAADDAAEKQAELQKEVAVQTPKIAAADQKITQTTEALARKAAIFGIWNEKAADLLKQEAQATHAELQIDPNTNEDAEKPVQVAETAEKGQTKSVETSHKTAQGSEAVTSKEKASTLIQPIAEPKITVSKTGTTTKSAVTDKQVPVAQTTVKSYPKTGETASSGLYFIGMIMAIFGVIGIKLRVGKN